MNEEAVEWFVDDIKQRLQDFITNQYGKVLCENQQLKSKLEQEQGVCNKQKKDTKEALVMILQKTKKENLYANLNDDMSKGYNKGFAEAIALIEEHINETF